jgi:hypothetical protein
VCYKYSGTRADTDAEGESGGEPTLTRVLGWVGVDAVELVAAVVAEERRSRGVRHITKYCCGDCSL